MPVIEPEPSAWKAPEADAPASGARRLLRQVAAVRRRLLRLILLEGVLWMVLGVVALLAAGMAADWWLGLPRPVRAALLALNLAVAAGVGWRRLVLPLARAPRHDALALLVERRRPDLRSRLISAIQLSRAESASGEARAFIRRLVADARQATATLDAHAVVPAQSVRRALVRVGPALVLAGLLFVAGWPTSGILFRRAFLDEVPVPRKTRLVEVTGARTLGRGDDLVVSAMAEGVLPPAGRLILRHASGRTQSLPMDADAERRGRYERVLANLQTSFEYRMVVNDAESETFRVEVLPRPVVTNLVLTQTLPAYTGLPPRTLLPGELTLLRGSRLGLKGEASQPLRQVVIRLEGLEETVEAVVDPGQPSRFEVVLPIDDPRLNSFAVHLVDRQGIASRESAVYALEVVQDRAPSVRVVVPARREELATARGTVLVAFEAQDDYGLAALRLRYGVAGESGDGQAIDLDLAEGRDEVVRRRFPWNLAAMRPPPSEGAMWEFWIEAVDANDQDGPGVGRSDRYLLRVVSDAEKRADLLMRAGDAIGRLGGVADGQERLNETLGRIILAKPPEAGSPSP